MKHLEIEKKDEQVDFLGHKLASLIKNQLENDEEISPYVQKRLEIARGIALSKIKQEQTSKAQHNFWKNLCLNILAFFSFQNKSFIGAVASLVFIFITFGAINYQDEQINQENIEQLFSYNTKLVNEEKLAYSYLLAELDKDEEEEN